MRTDQQVVAKIFLVVLLTAGMALLLSSGVAAHPSLRSNESSPAPGALLSASPSQVRLVFNTEPDGLIAEQSLFWVYKEAGAEVVATGEVDLSEADRNVMTASLPSLSPGVYRVKWVAVSRSDTGFSEGSYSFAVQ